MHKLNTYWLVVEESIVLITVDDCLAEVNEKKKKTDIVLEYIIDFPIIQYKFSMITKQIIQ